MSYPVGQLIYRAYRYAGVIAEAGRFYSQSQSDDGLQVLNSMLDEWQAERIMAWAKVRTVFNLVANKQIYTIGQDGLADFNFQRPEVVEQAGFIFTNVTPTIEQPMRILSQQEWAALTPKQLTSTIPTMLYYEQTVPDGTIWIWAIPTTAWGPALALYLWTNLAEVTDANAIIDMPPAYRKAIELNLGYQLAMQFPNRAKPANNLRQEAALAKRRISTINSPRLLMQTESAAGGVGGSRNQFWSIFANRYISS